MGVLLAEDKTEGPAQWLMFLGIELDSIPMKSRLPEAKLVDLQSRMVELLGKRKVLLHDLQVVVRHLNFVRKVVAPGRAFLRQLCDTMKWAI